MVCVRPPPPDADCGAGSAPEIPDPEAAAPANWDDEEDGVWEAPLVPNPKCPEGRCGVLPPSLCPVLFCLHGQCLGGRHPCVSGKGHHRCALGIKVVVFF